MQPSSHTFPAVRAYIFDVDGLLINSEDIYSEIYNNVLHSYGKPDLPWTVKARQQSRGREVIPTPTFALVLKGWANGENQGMLELLDWAQLPITYDEWTAKVNAQYELFRSSFLLPGVSELLFNLSSKTDPTIHVAIASSATSKTFKLKTSHLPIIGSTIPRDCCVFGDDKVMSEARKKPMPDIFLLALERINDCLGTGEKKVKPDECLVFEDSVAGVEAGRRAGMRVCWVPHKGLRDVWRGREAKVLEGTIKEDKEDETNIGSDDIQETGQSGEQGHLWSKDGWAEMLMSLQDFDYSHYGTRLKNN